MTNRPTTSEAAVPPTLLVIDGHAYAYRAFFAIRHLNSPSGQATNAIYGFIRMFTKVVAQVRPTHVMVIWDGGLASERMALLPDYKAQRAAMPDDLEQQLDQIVAYLEAARVTSWMKDGCEADDAIAEITRRATTDGINVIIASSDKDFMQLVSPTVFLFNPSDKTETLCGVEQVEAKTGVKPAQIVDWLSLIGDNVDNIPGVPGVGPKTATQLLQQFGSIEELYRRLPEVNSERLRASLLAAVDVVQRNQKMVRLNDAVGCAVALDDLEARPVGYEDLRALYAGWGFKTLTRELDEAHGKTEDLFLEKGVPV